MIFEILLPNTKPIVVGTIYPAPKQTSFMEIFNENLSKVDTCFLKTNRGHSQSTTSQKERSVTNSQEWINSKISEKLIIRDKLFK